MVITGLYLITYLPGNVSRALLMASNKALFYLVFSSTFLFQIAHQAVTISVSPKTLTKSNRTVRIQWYNVPNPSPLDFLGIYSPPSSRDNEFIGYVYLNSSDRSASGSGSVSLPLTNTRSNYQFRIFRWTYSEINPKKHDHDQNPLPQTKHRLAVSEEIGFGSEKLGPDQVHLAFTDQIDEMRVMFVMGDKSPSSVRYGKEMEQLDVEVGTEVRRYEREDMCDFPANSSIGWRDPGWIHDGVMKGLESGKKYYYQVGSDANGWTPIHSFISRDNRANETIAFLFGDMGTAVPYSTFYRSQDESASTVKWILRDLSNLGDKPAFISHIGDISYARGFSWIWDEFFNLIEPVASIAPYHVCIGNHEYDWPAQPWKPSWASNCYGKDGGGECGIPYSLRFKMPGNSSFPTGTKAPHTQNLYYSFDVGVVHFLYISTETDFLKGSDQYNFIEKDLRTVNREKTPFVVVQGHRPMYTTSYEDRDVPLRDKMIEHLEPVLVEYNVTLALWGHVHRYERFCPMRKYECVGLSSNFTLGNGAPVHVVIGMGGQDWQAMWEPRSNHPDMPIYPQPERSMYRGGEFGYTRLFATREKMKLEYVGNHDGQVHDVLEIFSGLDQNIVEKLSDVDGDTVSESGIPKYVFGLGILVVGMIVGCLVGFLIRCKKDVVPRNTWTPVKSEET